MTDDLVARLRHEQELCAVMGDTKAGTLVGEAADRLEALEIKERESFQQYVDANEARIEAEARVRELQASLMFWMPGVRNEDSADNERAADDSYLLAGFDGELSQRCWGDEMLTRVRELGAVNAALNERAAQYERLYRNAEAEAIERCAQAVHGAVQMIPMGQVDASEFLDVIEDAIATAIRNLAQEVKHEAE